MIIEAIAITTATALGFGTRVLWERYDGLRHFNRLKADYDRQMYLSQRYREIYTAGKNLGDKTYVYCRNPAQITSRIYNNKLREVVADFSSCGQERKLIFDKTSYEVEFKTAEIMGIYKTLGLVVKQDGFGIYVEADEKGKEKEKEKQIDLITINVA